MNNRDIMNMLMQETYKWIVRQRSVYGMRAKRIGGADRERLLPYFKSRVLDSARVASVGRIDNPPFYPRLKDLGLSAIDFREMDGITFVDCILMSKAVQRNDEDRLSILFHEMVHVVQYRYLGVRRFLEQYLAGWIKNRRDYSSIPLEKQAYDLQRRFDRGERFSVESKLGILFLF
jgi:hypothetical protein